MAATTSTGTSLTAKPDEQVFDPPAPNLYNSCRCLRMLLQDKALIAPKEHGSLAGSSPSNKSGLEGDDRNGIPASLRVPDRLFRAQSYDDLERQGTAVVPGAHRGFGRQDVPEYHGARARDVQGATVYLVRRGSSSLTNVVHQPIIGTTLPARFSGRPRHHVVCDRRAEDS
ncbi:hypothetical protein BCV69DRAFT_44253 [Microstroma glucosiphilum]|uniref:Uncharacterized protein n=1 Tax=Pseudomicrostroma glucosiphilum TaxID=1684307 RepID=A0A316U2M5_9BASI|nr:hypothetical protein BCV69DRAFT_44253 [Pseudomicrostroma glucosiphilum]PWN19088.1 hypothetical protein BCV69DRAFT_44253 [Pseudomicrostroma glucosiphilum]